MIGLEYICRIFKVEHKDLADKLKISAPNISIWLKGTREIPNKYLPVLSKIFKGISSEYFNRELTHIDELKIQIYYIEKMDFEDRHGELVVYDLDNENELLMDEYIDDYEEQLQALYVDLNQSLMKESYQNRIKQILEKIWALDAPNKQKHFEEKNAEELIILRLNSYLGFMEKFDVKGLNTIESIINYFNHYHGIEESRWQEQELFPNEKMLAFYKDLEAVLSKHKVI